MIHEHVRNGEVNDLGDRHMVELTKLSLHLMSRTQRTGRAEG